MHFHWPDFRVNETNEMQEYVHIEAGTLPVHPPVGSGVHMSGSCMCVHVRPVYPPPCYVCCVTAEAPLDRHPLLFSMS